MVGTMLGVLPCPGCFQHIQPRRCWGEAWWGSDWHEESILGLAHMGAFQLPLMRTLCRGSKWLCELWDKGKLLVCCKKHSPMHFLFLGVTSAGAELLVQGWGLPTLLHWGCNGSQAVQLTQSISQGCFVSPLCWHSLF